MYKLFAKTKTKNEPATVITILEIPLVVSQIPIKPPIKTASVWVKSCLNDTRCCDFILIFSSFIELSIDNIIAVFFKRGNCFGENGYA